jgi:dTDP-4-dehydrorhamnose 3,5-epimerase-like enzyme
VSQTFPTIEKKCWGEVRHIFDGPVSVSLLRVEAGTFCSTHYHRKRWNRFFVVSGRVCLRFFASIEPGSNYPETTHILILSAGEFFSVPPMQTHSFEVLESGRIVETYWTEDDSPAEYGDIVRFNVGGRIED